jgi:hypothetical protein
VNRVLTSLKDKIIKKYFENYSNSLLLLLRILKIMEKYSLSFKTLLFHSLLLIGQVFSQDSGTAGNPRGQHCRGFNAEEIRKFFLMNRFAPLL